MCCDLLLRILRSLCGPAPRPVDDRDPAAHERLLGRSTHVSSSPPQAVEQPTAQEQHLGRLSQVAVQNSSIPAECTTTIIVMRHGHRQDEEDSFWHQNASRPWDPPLSVKGRLQARDAAAKLDDYSIDYVITSPFQRCLQTSAGVVKQLPNLLEGQWLVDWQLAEICDPRVLFSSRHDIKQELGSSSSVDSWMWNGLSLDGALDKFVTEECNLNKVLLRPLIRPTKVPRYPERLDQGLKRYSHALQEIGQNYAGKTVVVVTHGECVRTAVLLAEPNSEVFEVKHTGFVVLQQRFTPAATAGAASPRSRQKAAAGGWKLTSEPGETGVLWLEDDD